jgi:6-phosphogluconolactonase
LNLRIYFRFLIFILFLKSVMVSPAKVVVADSVTQTIDSLIEQLLSTIEALNAHRSFITIGLSGGSFIEQFSTRIPNYLDRLKPFVSKLRFIFCDERFVPLDHSDSTFYGFKKNNLFSLLNVADEQVYHIKADAENVEQCAQDYEARLRPLLNENQGFDILFLGMGPDGHTCSLFPDHKLFLEADRQTNLVLPIADSPKPPPQRVTLTLPFINRSNYLMFCAVGEGKAEMIKRILKDDDLSLPSSNVKPTTNHGLLFWFLDKPAAKLL